MRTGPSRRDFLELLSVGGLAFASGLAGCSTAVSPGAAVDPTKKLVEDFSFLQLSDTHWGFQGPPNPEADVTLERAVAVVNASPVAPDFIVFTGDLSHATDEASERRARMAKFKEIVAKLKVKDVRFLPGEHDAAQDHGEAYQEAFGALYQGFDHKGVRFLALDNVSRGGGVLGDEQLHWLDGEVKKLATGAPLVVLVHRPLFDLFPSWDWSTKDGALAIEILSKHDAVTVFYGHIHQEHHQMTGKIAHHAARSLIFPLPAPGSVPKKGPLPWDPAAQDHGLGYRGIDLVGASPKLREIPLVRAT